MDDVKILSTSTTYNEPQVEAPIEKAEEPQEQINDPIEKTEEPQEVAQVETREEPKKESNLTEPKSKLEEPREEQKKDAPLTEPKLEEPKEEPKTESKDPLDELGLEGENKESFKKIVDAFKAGKLKEYLEISTINYDKLSPEELFRIDLKRKHPHLSKEKIDILLEDKIAREYGEDDDPNSPGQIRKESDAYQIREALKKEQAEYTIPEYKDAKVQITEDQQKELDAFKKMYESDPTIQAFETKGVLTLSDESGNAVSFEVEKDLDLKGATFDPNKFFSLFVDPNTGKTDLKKWALTVNYARSMDMVHKTLIDYGKSLGEKAIADELKGTNTNVEEAPPQPSEGVRIIGWK